MKKKIYTKHRLDYAYFMEENGKRTKIDAFALSRLENLMCRPEKMELPKNQSITNTHAYYFDSETQELRKAEWFYETSADDRGYVEVHFETLEEISKEVPYDSKLIERLVILLLTTYQKSLAGDIILLNGNEIFDPMPEEEKILPFLSLYYQLLPSKQTQNIIFISQYSNFSISMGKYPKRAEDVVNLQELPDYLMELLHGAETLIEYRFVLKALGRELFNENINLSVVQSPADSKSISEKCQSILAFWKKVYTKRARMPEEEEYRHNFCTWAVSLIKSEIQKLSQIPSYPVFLREYQQILSAVRRDSGNVIFPMIREEIQLQTLHRQENEKIRLQEGYQAICQLGKEMLSEDVAYYTELCFSWLYSAKTGAEFRKVLTEITFGSDSDFFGKISAEYLNKEEARKSLDLISADMLEELKRYNGIGMDEEFQKFSEELQTVQKFALMADFDLQKFLFRHYAEICKNKLLFQKMLPYFGSSSMTLADILTIIKQFKLEDFFTGFNIKILNMLITALKSSDIGEPPERETFCAFLRQYKIFREQYDSFIDQQEKVQDMEVAVNRLYEYCTDLIVSHVNAYNICSVRETKEILIFINKSILGNPAVVLFLMYAYVRKFIGKTEVKHYNYCYQFYELLLLPLITENEFSIADIRYLMTMFQKNDFEPREKSLKEQLMTNFEPVAPDIGLKVKEEKYRSFQEMLLKKMLGQSEQCQGAEELASMIATANEKYLHLIYESQLRKYYDDYIAYFRKYITNMIKNF